MDRRTKYTQKIIKETLIELLEEKDINKITVSEICEIADIKERINFAWQDNEYDYDNRDYEDELWMYENVYAVYG